MRWIVGCLLLLSMQLFAIDLEVDNNLDDDFEYEFLSINFDKSSNLSAGNDASEQFDESGVAIMHNGYLVIAIYPNLSKIRVAVNCNNNKFYVKVNDRVYHKGFSDYHAENQIKVEIEPCS